MSCEDVEPDDTTYRAAVVGLGRIGWLADQDERRPRPRSHVMAWQFCPGAELVAVCDEGYRPHEFDDELFAESLGEMLRRSLPLDVVSIATPPHTHAAIICALAAAKVHLVVSEKPLAESVGGAAMAVRACAESGTILLTNHGRRFHPMIQSIKAELDKGRIGRPLSAIAVCSGGLWSGATHMVDLLRWFLGDVLWVSGHRRGPCAENGVEPGYDTHFWFRDGVTASLHAVDIRRYVRFDLTIFGEEGTLALDEACLRARWGKAEASYPLAGGYRHVVAQNGLEAAPTTFLGEMAAHAVAVLDGTESPASTGEDGLACVRVLEAIERSHVARGLPIVP